MKFTIDEKDFTAPSRALQDCLYAYQVKHRLTTRDMGLVLSTSLFNELLRQMVGPLSATTPAQEKEPTFYGARLYPTTFVEDREITLFAQD